MKYSGTWKDMAAQAVAAQHMIAEFIRKSTTECPHCESKNITRTSAPECTMCLTFMCHDCKTRWDLES